MDCIAGMMNYHLEKCRDCLLCDYFIISLNLQVQIYFFINSVLILCTIQLVSLFTHRQTLHLRLRILFQVHNIWWQYVFCCFFFFGVMNFPFFHIPICTCRSGLDPQHQSLSCDNFWHKTTDTLYRKSWTNKLINYITVLSLMVSI